MIFNTIANRSDQKKAIPFQQKTNAIDNRNSILQRHVTFRDSYRHKQQIINPTSKPKYHFTYGQPIPQISHKQILSQSIYRNIQPSFQTFQIQPRQSLRQDSFVKNERNRSESRRKKGLKIFPQKYDESKKKIQKTVQEKLESPKVEINNQVKELKEQIQKLKLLIKSLSLNISKNTSRDLTETQINKNEAQRTRRLSELNQFNQKLYNELALKLKNISITQYENYLDQTNSNKKILEQIFSSASKSRADHGSEQKKRNLNQNFIDIKEFQQQYQQKYNSTGATENPIQNYDFIPQNIPSQKNQLGSPFLIGQNTSFQPKTQNKFNQTDSNMKTKLSKDQVFTFHKQKMNHPRHFTKPLYNFENQLFTLEGQGIENKREKQKNQNKKAYSFIEINKVRNTENSFKTKKQIEDFNRELENKIFKKRVNSQFITINKQKKY